MPDLVQTLQGHDLGFLKIIANAWGIELNAPDVHVALPLLINGIQDAELLNEVIEALPVEAQTALRELLANDGRLPWTQFSRRYGDLRVMGAARRDRERPDLQPASPAEVLWYRALIGKAFLNLPSEPQEYAYIPDDLVDFLPDLPVENAPIMGRPASPAETGTVVPANDRILDDACSLLANLRSHTTPDEYPPEGFSIPLEPLTGLLRCAGLINLKGQVVPEEVRGFLECSRAEALLRLVTAWKSSSTLNELRWLPGLEFEGEWNNRPQPVRQRVLDMLSRLPQDRWWNISAFRSAVKEHQPDYLRTAGEYDSWFIKRQGGSDYLKGFAAWDEIDGALLVFFITAPLHWLGFYDLAAPTPDAPPAAFRPSAWAPALWHDAPPENMLLEDRQIQVNYDGAILVPRLAPRAARYQIARFARWAGFHNDQYTYQLTPGSLQAALKQGLRYEHLINLLKKHCAHTLPPTLVKAIQNLEQHGIEAEMESVLLLTVTAPEILEQLQNSDVRRHIVRLINPTTAVIRASGARQVQAALAKLGHLAKME